MTPRLGPALAAAAVLTAGCRVGPDYIPPTIEAPPAWRASDEAIYSSEEPQALSVWWQALGDAALDGLIDRALRGSLSLAVAVQRVRNLAALRGRAFGERFPDIDADGGYARSRFGQNSFPPQPSAKTFDLYDVGLLFSWEIDLWGRVTRSIEAADADLAASIEDLRDVRVLLVAEVAAEYVALRASQARVAVANSNIEIQRRSLELTEARFNAGAAPALDVAQARRNLANTEAELPTLQAEIRLALLNLSLLLGDRPDELLEELADAGPLPEPPPTVVVGVPAEALRRRPDVRSAERRLAAEVARIGVELGDLYPRFTLGGSIGFESTASTRWFDTDSGIFGFGPSFQWNLFDGGRELGELRAQRAQADIALLDYRSSVLNAVAEVEDSLFQHVRERERAAALRRSAAAARESAVLSRELYLAGRSDFQNVLDAERSLFEAEDLLIRSRSEVAQTYVALHRALGGGWEPRALRAGGD
ncbi:MAG: efflux transporter outer membrane subunit [Planctomycetota bacterium]